ncbi:MAG: energy transducer TonB [Bacteroidales bacterium]|nr:energy transducer TonB [Bacteroidales bacterium]
MFLLLTFSPTYSQIPDSIETDHDNQIQNVQEQPGFAATYGLEGLRGIRAKMLDDGQLRSEPDNTSQPLNIRVPKDEIVYVYRYFGDEKCWATKYGENWGFLDDHLIFPVRETEPETASKYDVPPQLKSKISPVYPEEAKKAGIKGKVYIKVFIDKEGKAKETIILQGINELNAAAIQAVKEAKYGPAKLNGKPVGIWVNLSIEFE